MPNNIWLDDDIPDENKWNLIKLWRDDMLSRCDWTQLTDTVLTSEQRLAWAAYRQLLRDIPQDYATPEEVIWPQKPE